MRDADDWASRREYETVRDCYFDRTASKRTLLTHALGRYTAELSFTKRVSSARREMPAGANLKTVLGANAALAAFRTALANCARPVDTDVMVFGAPGRDSQLRVSGCAGRSQRSGKASE